MAGKRLFIRYCIFVVVVTATRGDGRRRPKPEAASKVRKAAVATFVKYGYDGTTMEAIARAAGITRRTLYARYPDKRAVFVDVIPWALTRRTEREIERRRTRRRSSRLADRGRPRRARARNKSGCGPVDAHRNERIDPLSRVRRQRALDDVVGAASTGHGSACPPPGGGAIELEDLELAAGNFIAMIEHLPGRLAQCGIYRSAEEEERHCNTPSICSFAACCAALNDGLIVTMPGLVLVHGGAHAADCWDLTVAELARQAPELRVLAIDLPGRGSRPADLETVTVADWVNSVVADIADAGLGDVVVVGHSMAGLTVPGSSQAGARPGAQMVLLTAFVPPQGTSVVDTLRGPLAPLARAARRFRRRSECLPPRRASHSAMACRVSSAG